MEKNSQVHQTGKNLDLKTYQTITIHKQVGCGSVYCMFLEDEGAFHKLTIRGDMARQTPCMTSWFDPVSRLLTFALRRALWEGTAEKGILKHLINEHDKCSAYVPNEHHISSCADAIGKAVKQYLLMKGFVYDKIPK